MTVNTGLSLTAGQRTTPEYLSHLKEAVNATENPVKYLSIDPGKSNGVCGYDEKYYLVFMLTIQAEDMTLFLHQFDNVTLCIVENFMLFPNKTRQQIYSDMQTSRVIGNVESWAQVKKVELVKQNPSIKPTGYLWLGKKALPKSNSQNHCMDAHVHFIYWAVKNNRINAADLLRKPPA